MLLLAVFLFANLIFTLQAFVVMWPLKHTQCFQAQSHDHLMLFPFANIQCYRFCLSRFVGSFYINFDMFWQLIGLQHHLINNIGVQRSIVSPNFALGLLIHWGPHCSHFAAWHVQPSASQSFRRLWPHWHDAAVLYCQSWAPWLRSLSCGQLMQGWTAGHLFGLCFG